LVKPEKAAVIHILPRTDFELAVGAFVVDRQARALSPSTIRFYREELAHLRAYLEKRGVLSVESVTPGLLRDYLLELGTHRSAGGQHGAYRAMRAFLRWYESEYEPVNWSNPIVKVAPPKVPLQMLEPVSLAHLRAMLATCERRTFRGDRDRCMLLALLDTGCRAAEFLGLSREDVNLSTGAVIVKHGKGSKWRTVFLGAKSRRELLRYLRHRGDGAGPLWVCARGGPLTYGGLRSVLKRRAQMAGVPVPGIHSFRRAFALLMLKSGADVLSISRLLGHANLALLMRYIRQRGDDLGQVHGRAGPVNHLL
jgi:site-specific recombinase XerD